MIEKLAKMVVEKTSEGNMRKPMFEDSDRGSEIELPQTDNLDEIEPIEEESYLDSDRYVPEGAQWDETEGDGFYPDSDRYVLEGPQWEADQDADTSKEKEKPENSRDIDDNKEQVDDAGEKKGLTDEEKKEIKEKTGWSDEIIDAIGSMEEAQIYMDAGLQEVEIAGKKCLIRSDIDMDQLDEDGISNRERMERGRPPLTKDGQEVELHHIGQKPDSPLAELTTQEHRGVGNDTILHDKNKESEIDRNEFAKDRKNHWKSRAEEGGA